MKIVRLSLAVVACAIWGAQAYLGDRAHEILQRVAGYGSRDVNPETGQMYEILFRGGAVRYVTKTEAWTVHLAFGLVPFSILAVTWIVWEMHRLGIYKWRV